MRRGEGVASCIKGRWENLITEINRCRRGGKGATVGHEGAEAVMRRGVAWSMKIFRLTVASHHVVT